jgi:hypothetical protein
MMFRWVRNLAVFRRFRKIELLILIAMIWLLPDGLQAQVSEPSDPLQLEEGGSTDEVANLDLFDEDTELTKKGWSQFYVAAGFMHLDGDGSFSLRLPNGKDVTIIDFDRAGLKDTDSSYWLALNWRSANSRWGAWLGSWQYDAVGSRIWEESLPIGDDREIPVGASVSSDFDAKWYILEATYSVYRTSTIDAGIGFGFHIVDIDTTASVNLEVGDEGFEDVSTNLDTLAPLPNGLIYLHWKFAPKWNLVTRVGYFSLDYDKYSGSMTNAHAMVNRQLSSRWTLGVGYQFVDLDLDIEKDDYLEIYDVQFSGPLAFLRYGF